MQGLERFINYLTHHDQLSNSDELKNFLTSDHEQYEKGKKRLDKYVEENKYLEKKSTIKTLMDVSRSFISSYFQKQKKPTFQSIVLGKTDMNFNIVFDKVME